MKWVYLGLWLLLAARNLPSLWRSGQKRVLLLWVGIAGAGLAMGIWCFWLDTQWRLAEWLMELKG